MKYLIRKELKHVRKNISNFRKKQAQCSLYEFFSEYLEHFSKILSFSSMEEEINLWPINDLLMEKNKLFLPKVSKEHLEIYQVSNKKFLQINSFKILEPDPTHCIKTKLQEIDLILVPGLGFSIEGFRIGYGKGFYDRLLSSSSSKAVAVGYKEQLCSKIPIEQHDQKVNELFLF